MFEIRGKWWTAVCVTAGIAGAVAVAPLASAESFAGSAPSSSDELTVTVTDSRVAGHNRSYRLTCDPVGGTHPDPEAACERIAGFGEFSAKDPFAPVPASSMCTQVYGGPARAQVSGTWRGSAVDARFKRTNGCEIGRWDNLTPLLPIESA